MRYVGQMCCSSVNTKHLTIVLAECAALGAFAKLRKVTFSLIMSVRLSINQLGTTLFSLDGFSWSFTFGYFSKICCQIRIFFKIRQEWRYFIWTLYIFLIISRSILLTTRNVSDKSWRENRKKKHFLFNSFFFRNSGRLWDNMEKYGTAWHTTDTNTEHVRTLFNWATNIHWGM